MAGRVEKWRKALRQAINPPPLVQVVRLSGVIGRGSRWQGGLSLEGLDASLKAAFEGNKLAAVALAINSPGGSPVQSALIAGRIRALAEEKKIPVLAFVEDVAASGGYWLACAADEIFADRASIVGSIGVISAGFGFPRLLERWGIDRRVYHQGEHKSMLDPFRPENPDDIARLLTLQEDIHIAFRDHVRTRRGERLKAEDATLFNGDIWTGARALDLGLIDGLGDLRQTLRARFGEDVRIRTIGEPTSWLRRKLGVTAALAGGASAFPAPEHWINAVENRLEWQRYGL